MEGGHSNTQATRTDSDSDTTETERGFQAWATIETKRELNTRAPTHLAPRRMTSFAGRETMAYEESVVDTACEHAHTPCASPAARHGLCEETTGDAFFTFVSKPRLMRLCARQLTTPTVFTQTNSKQTTNKQQTNNKQTKKHAHNSQRTKVRLQHSLHSLHGTAHSDFVL